MVDISTEGRISGAEGSGCGRCGSCCGPELGSRADRQMRSYRHCLHFMRYSALTNTLRLHWTPVIVYEVYKTIISMNENNFNSNLMRYSFWTRIHIKIGVDLKKIIIENELSLSLRAKPRFDCEPSLQSDHWDDWDHSICCWHRLHNRLDFEPNIYRKYLTKLQ